jgi:hypothetical protein
MILRMARPWKHSDSGIYYVRERLPRDIPAKARGLKVALPAAAGGSRFSVRATSACEGILADARSARSEGTPRSRRRPYQRSVGSDTERA